MTTPLPSATTSADERTRAAALLGAPDIQVRGVTEFRIEDGVGGSPAQFEGWACRWDVVDSYGTSFRKGAFIAGGLDSDPYALLWMHNPSEPIGTFTAEERDDGLWITGSWDDTPEGNAKRSMASGSAPGLSVGF
ncbi:MAG: HK97 family phage prohead protease, partial [Phycicoccus sp.]